MRRMLWWCIPLRRYRTRRIGLWSDGSRERMMTSWGWHGWASSLAHRAADRQTIKAMRKWLDDAMPPVEPSRGDG